MFKWMLAAVAAGFILDLLIGDPRWLYHPVRAIGKLIEVLEKLLRGIFPKDKSGERKAGFFLVVFVVGITAFISYGILFIAFKIHVILGFFVETFMSYQILATRSLKEESMRVYDALETGNLQLSRQAVSMIVGRDTENLDEVGVTKATVETIAENASDGVIAPLFYLIIGGPVLGFAYKAVNTMDSMVGYKNERFQYFGTCAARFDDVVNYIPARLSALIMILASYFCGLKAQNAWRIYRRDRYNHASPNSAQTEAVMAGALDVQLAGDAWYFGKLHKKPFIGDAGRKIQIADIKKANNLLYVSSILSLMIFALVRILFFFFVGM